MSPLSFLPSFLIDFFFVELIYIYIYIYIYILFEMWASLQSLGNHRGPPASVSWTIERKVCTTTTQLNV